MQENHLFFNETTDEADASGEGAMFPASAFLGADCTGTREVSLSFASRNGAATDDVVALTHADVTGASVKEVMRQVAAALSSTKGRFQHQSLYLGRNAPSPDGFVKNITGIAITTAA